MMFFKRKKSVTQEEVDIANKAFEKLRFNYIKIESENRMLSSMLRDTRKANNEKKKRIGQLNATINTLKKGLGSLGGEEDISFVRAQRSKFKTLARKRGKVIAGYERNMHR